MRDTHSTMAACNLSIPPISNAMNWPPSTDLGLVSMTKTTRWRLYVNQTSPPREDSVGGTNMPPPPPLLSPRSSVSNDEVTRVRRGEVCSRTTAGTPTGTSVSLSRVSNDPSIALLPTLAPFPEWVYSSSMPFAVISFRAFPHPIPLVIFSASSIDTTGPTFRCKKRVCLDRHRLYTLKITISDMDSPARFPRFLPNSPCGPLDWTENVKVGG